MFITAKLLLHTCEKVQAQIEKLLLHTCEKKHLSIYLSIYLSLQFPTF